MLVPWYLILSYLYYVCDVSVTSDEFYDKLCRNLLDKFDEVEHSHKHLVDKGALSAGTGYYLKFDCIEGRRVVGAATELLKRFMPWEWEALRRPTTRKRRKGKK